MLKKISAALAALVSIGGTSVAMAAVPTEASDAVTLLATDAGTFVGSLWAIITVVVVAFVFMKLFRKGVNKAT